MKSIVFTHSYFMRFDPKQWKTMQPYPPLATIYAASLMRENGFNVSLFDTMFVKSAEELLPELKKNKPAYVVLYDDGFNYLTKMCLTNMREAAFRMIELAKEQGSTVIVSSSDATDHCEKYLSKGADYIVIGEAEETLLELITSLEQKNQRSINEIKGLAFKNGEEIKHTGKREVIKNLDQLPSPAWDLIDVELYKKYWIKKNGYFSLNMVTTRGCPYKCNWCAKPIYGNRYNSHSAERTVNELKLLIQKYKPDHIWFCDDIFGLKPEWLKSFGELVKENELSFRFKIQSRVDLLLEENSVRYLSESGCDTVWLGAESGSQKILDAMDKGITVEQIYKARPLLKKYGIRCAFFLQFGYLGETKEDEEATFKMVLELMPDEIGVSVSYPLPGTKFYEKVKDQLSQKANWTDSDDMSMMFRTNVHPQYYKYLQRYIHKIYQMNKRKNILLEVLENPFKINLKKLISIPWMAYYSSSAYLVRKKML